MQSEKTATRIQCWLATRGLSDARVRADAALTATLAYLTAPLLIVLVATPAAGAASGDSYPAKTIRIVTAEAGSGNDLMVRLLAPGLTASLGQPVIVDNRGMISIEMAAKAAPDGYTLLAFGPPVWVLPLLRSTVPWDAVRDFSPITLAMSSPIVVGVHPSLPVRSIKELIALAKAKPGTLNYAGSFPGSTSHLAAELFKTMAGVNIVYVSYKGPASALNAAIGGEAPVIFANAAASIASQIKAGRLRALGVASAQPSALFPDVPTVSAAGLPGYESATIVGLFAPAKTPEAVIDRLNREMVRILRAADVKEKLAATGSEVVASTPEHFAAAIKAELVTWGKVIKDAGVREQ